MAELKINLPFPDPSFIIILLLASDPLMGPDTVIPPLLLIPNVNPAVLVIPFVLIVNVLVPVVASVLILDAEATVIVPVNVAAFEVLTNLMAPSLLIPIPLMVIGSGILSAADTPLSCNAAPATTVVAPVVVPKALLF